MKKKFFLYLLFIFVIFITNVLIFCKIGYCKKNHLDVDSLYKKSLQDISRAFLGKSYFTNKESDLFEEPPVFKTNGFDCVTFVEMVLGYHVSANFDELYDNLKKIKYKYGSVDFFERNHFMTSDWIPNNSWLLKNITTKITNNYRTKTIKIDKKLWFMTAHKNLYEALILNNQEYKMDKFNSFIQYVDYIPWQIILNNEDFLKKLPVESLIFIVKDMTNLKKKIGTELDVSHVGFLFKKKNIFDKNVLVFRHASSTRGKIVDVDFIKYIKNNVEKSNKFQGIIILTLNKQYE